ncbi:amidohydrolase family protein (plasmid) [Streptomyces sp. BI20]|uniref:amidohydrolase family protein n=1 Tax=Streptomyces sp. BI20 TaxID=3403460 RepID=UPI003C745F18
MSGLIDVHHHVVPPAYRRHLRELGIDSGGVPVAPWSPEAALAVMDRAGIDSALLSVSAPGVNLPGREGEAARLARLVNEYAAGVRESRPDRFGFLASLPLAEGMGAARRELEHALGTLGADGVMLMSNHLGVYLGDELFRPLWAALDEHAATVLVHPIRTSALMVPGIPYPMVDFPHDTTRTAVHMALNRVLSTHPRVRVILAHGGGHLPYAVARFAALAPIMAEPRVTAETLTEELRAFRFDTALVGPEALRTLLAFARPGHVVYGSDWPYLPDSVGAEFRTVLALHESPPGTDRVRTVAREAAEGLFPRFARVTAARGGSATTP